MIRSQSVTFSRFDHFSQRQSTNACSSPTLDTEATNKDDTKDPLDEVLLHIAQICIANISRWWVTVAKLVCRGCSAAALACLLAICVHFEVNMVAGGGAPPTSKIKVAPEASVLLRTTFMTKLSMRVVFLRPKCVCSVAVYHGHV